jgi:hypothetical protein
MGIRNRQNVLEGSLNPDQTYPDKELFELYPHPLRNLFNETRLNRNTMGVKGEYQTPLKELFQRKEAYKQALEKSVEEYNEALGLPKRKAENENPYDENVFPRQQREPPLVTPPKKQKIVHRPIPEAQEMRPVRVRRKTVEEEVYTPRFSGESITPPRATLLLSLQGRGINGV